MSIEKEDLRRALLASKLAAMLCIFCTLAVFWARGDHIQRLEDHRAFMIDLYGRNIASNSEQIEALQKLVARLEALNQRQGGQ